MGWNIWQLFLVFDDNKIGSYCVPVRPYIVAVGQRGADMAGGSVNIVGGGGRVVELNEATVSQFVFLPEADPSAKVGPEQLNFNGIKDFFNLSKPLGRKAVYFWMDLFTAVMPPSLVHNPFKLSDLLTRAMQQGGYKEKSYDVERGIEKWTEYHFGFYPRAVIEPAPDVLRHYTSRDGLRKILESNELIAGPMCYAENIGGGSKKYYDEMTGIFFTTGQYTADEVGATEPSSNYYVEVTLPEKTPIVSLYRGAITLLFGPPGRRDWREGDAPLPYPPLRIPVKIVGFPGKGPARTVTDSVAGLLGGERVEISRTELTAEDSRRDLRRTSDRVLDVSRGVTKAREKIEARIDKP